MISSQAEVLTDVPALFIDSRDPDDEPYVNLALVAGASYLVSRDRDLLDLMDCNSIDGRLFRDRFPQLRILDPIGFLREVAQSRTGEPPLTDPPPEHPPEGFSP